MLRKWSRGARISLKLVLAVLAGFSYQQHQIDGGMIYLGALAVLVALLVMVFVLEFVHFGPDGWY